MTPQEAIDQGYKYFDWRDHCAELELLIGTDEQIIGELDLDLDFPTQNISFDLYDKHLQSPEIDTETFKEEYLFDRVADMLYDELGEQYYHEVSCDFPALEKLCETEGVTLDQINAHLKDHFSYYSNDTFEKVEVTFGSKTIEK